MENTVESAGSASRGKTHGTVAMPSPEPPFDFIAVVDRYETPLLRYAGLLLAPQNDGAEEIVQESFLRLHRQMLSKPRTIDNIEQWLFRVVHNCACDVLRKQKRNKKLREQATQDAAANGGSTGRGNMLDKLADAEMRERVIAEVENLPLEHKQVLLLKIIKGATFREIAAITGLSVSLISYRLDRALRELSQRLKDAKLI